MPVPSGLECEVVTIFVGEDELMKEASKIQNALVCGIGKQQSDFADAGRRVVLAGIVRMHASLCVSSIFLFFSIRLRAL